MTLIWQDELSVGIAGMDEHHKSFIELLARMNDASPAELAEQFQRFLGHLAEHFAYEERLMEEHGFPALREHRGEHLRVLAEARDMERLVNRGRTAMVQGYVRERVPEWFLLHRNTMDMATAAFLRGKGIS